MWKAQSSKWMLLNRAGKPTLKTEGSNEVNKMKIATEVDTVVTEIQ